MTILTRNDPDGMITAVKMFDSISWAFTVHVKEPDTKKYNYAILHGNEDCPLRIQFWKNAEPEWQEEPDYVWEAPKEAA